MKAMYKRIRWHLAEYDGKKMLFAPERVYRGSVPQGRYIYEIRIFLDDTLHYEIGTKIDEYFYGTLISDSPIYLMNDEDETHPYLIIDKNDIRISEEPMTGEQWKKYG